MSKNQNITEIVLEKINLLGEEISLVKGKLDDVMNAIDEVMGELKAVREEQTILSSQHGRILDLEEKMEKLEAIHPRGQHATA